MAKRFARQEHLQTFQTACNKTPQWPPWPTTHRLFRIELLQGERISTAHEGGTDSEDDYLERKSLAYDHIFSGPVQVGEKPVRILVEGGAGTGKTALCMLLFKGWENGIFFHNIELLLLLPLYWAEVTKARSIPQLIKTLFPSHNSDIISYLQRMRGEKVLIVADGFSELAETEFQRGSFLHNLLLGGLLSRASVLITSRQSASASLHKTHCSIDYFMEIYGFSGSTIRQYIRVKFSRDQQKAIGLLEQLETNRLIQEVCRIPLNCALVCYLWQTNQDLSLFSTTTGFLIEIILNFVYRNMLKNDAYSSHPRLLNIHSLPENLNNPWRAACQIAFQTLRFSSGVNPQIELATIGLSQPGLEILGILEFINKVTFSFVHPTFQEFFAALYLVMQPLDKQLEVFKLHTKSKHLTLFYRLFFGLYFQNCKSTSMAGISQIMRALSQSYAANNDEHLLCHYALEAKTSDVTKGILGILSNRTKIMKFGHPSTALDCHAVMYIIANIQEPTLVEIDFHNCHLGDKWICDELVPVLCKKSTIVLVKILNLTNNSLSDSRIVHLFSEETSSAFRYLAKLFLRDNSLGEQSVRAIKATLAKSSCSMNLLDLSNNPLSASGIKELQSAMESNNLKRLEILFLRGTLPTDNTSSNVTCLNAFAIAVSTHCPQLRRLDLSAIDLGEPGDEAIRNLVLHFTGTKTNFDLRLNREYMSEVDKTFMSVMEDCIKNKGTIDHTVVHGIIIGPGRSGKDSLMNRLLGKPPQDKDYLSASTGVLESVIKVEVKKFCCTTVAAAANDLIWRRLDYNKEALELMMSTAKHCSVAHDRKSHTLSQSKGDAFCDISQNDDSCDKPPEYSEGKLVRSYSLRVKPKPHVHYLDEYLHKDEFHETSMLHSQANQVLVVPVQDKWPSVTDVLKSAIESRRMDDLREHLESSWSLYLTNTGGQMEFQELLPLLVCGPSVFFVTFPLNKDLMEHYTVLYHHNDSNRTEETYQSPSTLMDEILQTLATINALDLTGHQQDYQPKPKVFLIGTHKDKLPGSDHLVEKRIQEIDQQLQEQIRPTSLFHQGSIEFAEGEKQLIFTVNNLAKDDTDFQKIRHVLQQAIDRTDQFTIKCPSTWLIFSLALRAKHKSSQILTYDECFTFAQGCGISDREELSKALFFIHTRLGLVRYFNVKELNKRVIIDPQILFDKITDLIVKTFVFDNADVNEVEKFQNQGIFFVETMKRICKKMHRSESQLPFKWLLKLLSHLRIAAVFKDKDGTFKCFFPAVLCHAPVQQQIPLKVSDSAQHDSLLVAFEGGFCPRGIPSTLITYLMTNEMNSEFSWDLLPHQVFKNQVCFSIEGYGDIILKIHSTHLQLYLDPETETNENELKLTLGEVYRCIEQGMKTISKGYKNCIHFFAVHCTMHNCKKYAHPAKIIWRDDHPVKLKCMVTGKQYNVPDHGIWDLRRVNYIKVQVPRQKLDLPLDIYNEGVPLHLGKIADSIPQWEGAIAEALGLTQGEIAEIKAEHPSRLNLQKRLSLQKWKQSKGYQATYGQLIAVFESAGYQDCADFVRKVANSIAIPSNDDKECSQSSLVPSPTEVESLFLTNSPADNRSKQEDIVYITENSANELKKLIDTLDIPLSSEPDANTASVVMKHNLKEQSSFKKTTASDESGRGGTSLQLETENSGSAAGHSRIKHSESVMQQLDESSHMLDMLTESFSVNLKSNPATLSRGSAHRPHLSHSISKDGSVFSEVEEREHMARYQAASDGGVQRRSQTLSENASRLQVVSTLSTSEPDLANVRVDEDDDGDMPPPLPPRTPDMIIESAGAASREVTLLTSSAVGNRMIRGRSEHSLLTASHSALLSTPERQKPSTFHDYSGSRKPKKQRSRKKLSTLERYSPIPPGEQKKSTKSRWNFVKKKVGKTFKKSPSMEGGNLQDPPRESISQRIPTIRRNNVTRKTSVGPEVKLSVAMDVPDGGGMGGASSQGPSPARRQRTLSTQGSGVTLIESTDAVIATPLVYADAHDAQDIRQLQQDQQQMQGQMGGVSQPRQPVAQQDQQGQSTQQGQQAAGGTMGQPPQGGQQQQNIGGMGQSQPGINVLPSQQPQQPVASMASSTPSVSSSMRQPGAQFSQQPGAQQQRQTTLDTARKYAEMAKQEVAEMQKSGPRTGPIGLQQPGSHSVMPGRTVLQQQLNIGGMGIGQGLGGMGLSQPGMNVLHGQQPQQQHQMGHPGNVTSSSVGSVQQGGGGVTVTAQVDMQFPLNPGVQQPDRVMMGAGRGMGMAGGATATSGGMAPTNLMTPARLRLEQIRAQNHLQTAAMQQMAAGGAGYPAGAAQGQQYATHPLPGPMQANPPMTMGQMMQAPQWAQYVQQPPSGPGVMMTGAPRPPIGYQFGMNPNMSGQPPMATGGYPAGAEQLQQYYGMCPPPAPMQLANPPMRQAMQVPQWAPQYQPSRPGMMMPGALRPPERSGQPGGGGGAGMIGTGGIQPTLPQSSQPGMNMSGQIPTAVSGMQQQQQRPPGMGMQMAPGMMNVPRPQQQMPPGSGGYW